MPQRWVARTIQEHLRQPAKDLGWSRGKKQKRRKQRKEGMGGEENQGAAVRNHHIVPQPLAPPIASPKELMRLSAKYGQKQEDKLTEMRWQVIC